MDPTKVPEKVEESAKKPTSQHGNHGTVRKKKRTKMRKKGIGFTNWLAIYLVLLLTVGLAMAFYLAKLSIEYNYMGQLLCFTVVFTPLGTAISIVLGKIVDKSRAENSAGDGTGIKFAQAQAAGFQNIEEILETTETGTQPPI